MSPLTSIHFQ